MNLEEALLQNRFNNAPPLSFDLWPNRLVDEAYCNGLSNKLLKKCSGKWEKLIASAGLSNSIPEKPGIYMFVWKLMFPFIFDDEVQHMKHVLYIGKAGDNFGSGTLRSRYKNEYSKYVKSDAEQIWLNRPLSSRSDRLNKFLNLYEIEYWFVVIDNCDDLSVINDFEDDLIKLFNPPINKSKAKLKAKYSKAEDAF